MSYFRELASGGSFVKFDDARMNQPVTCTITGPYSIIHSSYQGQPRFTKKGKPVYETQIPVDVDGNAMVLASGGAWRMEQAIADAIIASGAPDLEIGGKLTVTFTGYDASSTAARPPKLYSATYERATGDDVHLATPIRDERTQPQAVPQQQAAPQQQFAPQQYQQQPQQFAQYGAPQGMPQGMPQGAPQGMPAQQEGNPFAQQGGQPTGQNPWAA